MVHGVQVNHCKNPVCQNYGIPVEEASQKGQNRYTIVATGAKLPAAKCGSCGEIFGLKSNQGIFEEASGVSLADFFSRYIRGSDELELTSLFRSVGLVITVDRGEESGAWLGVTTRESGDAVTVTTSASGGPGEAAGLYAGDELVALDGFRLSGSALKARLRDKRVGEKVVLTVFRRDRLRTVEVTLGERPASNYTIEPAKDATAGEGAAFERWLGATLESLDANDKA